ncbi:MAG: epoxyqueuosine reductase [Spirochaetaceae bacterium]|nr:epoxyqueuosine reductase [Spirochaetaceae bacterium]
MISKIVIKKRIFSEGFSEVRFMNAQDENLSIIITSLPYAVSEKYSDNGARIAPFAQKNHYGEAIRKLKSVSRFIREEYSLKKSDIRLFCNSSLDEKKFAALSGLGFYGRNSLIITKEAGSRVILAGMILPVKFSPDRELDGGTIAGALCGSCRNCLKACPTSAIEENGKINRKKCLQSLATDPEILSESLMKKWGNRLYGCSICQDCCPFNRGKVQNLRGVTKGDLGNSIPFEFILRAEDHELKEFLKGSALSMSWIKPELLKRNAIISAASEKRTELIELIQKYTNHKTIAYAARWSLKEIMEQDRDAPKISDIKSTGSIILP